ncbi:MAG: sel1 repeat family protein [Desulfovibrio sp.]|nr:sel1 repeat family protein [Desulfovibrio sp.]
MEWLARASGQGHAEAQNNLGEMHRLGQGVPQDYGKAKDLLAKAASQGNAKAQCRIGLLYRNGEGVQEDKGRVKDWFDKACGARSAGRVRRARKAAEAGLLGWQVRRPRAGACARLARRRASCAHGRLQGAGLPERKLLHPGSALERAAPKSTVAGARARCFQRPDSQGRLQARQRQCRQECQEEERP